MTLEDTGTKLIVDEGIQADGKVGLEIYSGDWWGNIYYLDQNELIQLRDHLNKLIEQIK